MKKSICFVGSVLLLIASCNDTIKKNTGNSVMASDLKQASNDTVKVLPMIDIISILRKMKKQENLEVEECKFFLDFLHKNNDEARSEEIGYVLYNYLKGKPSNNKHFDDYLSKKETSFKEEVYINMVLVMCIDLGEGKYSYESFIKDFRIFKNSDSAKKAFEECMNNQVE